MTKESKIETKLKLKAKLKKYEDEIEIEIRRFMETKLGDDIGRTKIDIRYLKNGGEDNGGDERWRR